MGIENSFTQNSFRRLNIDRKMISILVVFTVLGVFLTISMIIATNTLSGLRGYATFQVNWTEARKDATFGLLNYIDTKDSLYLDRFNQSLQFIEQAKEIRIELLSGETEYENVRNLFLQTRTHPDDIDNMINTFEWFHSFGDFQIAIEEWIKSDEMISEMEALANETKEKINNSSFTEAQQLQFAKNVSDLDRKLIESKFRLASALSSGTQFLNFIMFWLSISLGMILFFTGGMLSFRFLKSIKNWEREIEVNEQKYRSLYEQNPNAVYSLSRSGHLISVNSVFEKIVGTPIEELKGVKFEQFIEKSEIEKVRVHFQKTVEGAPQNYETTVVLGNGKLIHSEITNLPIVVDGEITGVYGIARDITYRKRAEQRIKEQLEEKTHLISEIHDRVKNNLALISSLIQLQQNISGDFKRSNFFENTISRIHSMAMVHERLYHNETFSSIRMDEYVNELVETIQKKYSSPSSKIRLIIDTQPVILSIKQSIPTGLLLNELLINAFKHGVRNGKGRIEVSLFQNDDKVVIKVSDNGPGLPEDFTLENSKTLGITLISVLLRQLNADYQLSKTGGTSFSIQFKAEGKLSKIA